MNDKESKQRPAGSISSNSIPDESVPPRMQSAELTASPLVVPESAATSSLAPGDLLANRFRIIRFISKGGMGEVYEAEDLELRDRVAIKTVLPSIAANPAAIELFKQEIQLARKVTHPNVCRVFDLVYDSRASSPTAFLSMELLEGITLSTYIEKVGSVSWPEAMDLAHQMAEGLHAAHTAGIIHQDFKSANVIVTQPDEGGTQRAIITDFGLAHNARAAGTGSSKNVGTPAYMAPEQIDGGPVSVATDIYAFGVVLYELVTGHWPYNARTVEELQSKKLSQAPIPPSKYAPELPVRVERAILRCLAKSSQDRFGDALEVAAALEPPARRWLLPVAVAMLLAALGAIGGYQWRKVQAMTKSPTVAVIGFRNDSGDPNYDWLATELSESLTTELGGSKAIHTVPGDEVASAKIELSVAQSKSLEHEDLSSVRDALGANYLLIGRYAVVLPGPQLEFGVLLRDSRDKTILDIHESGQQAEYRKLITQAATQVRDRLGIARLSDAQVGELQNLYPSDLQVSQLYFQALDKLRSFDPTSALSLLKRAAERDPENVSIHWALSDAWSQLKHDREAAAEAQAAANLAAGASLPQEYVVLAQGRAAEMNKQWDSAIDAYKSLFRLFPEHLNYGLRLASAQTEGSHASNALATLSGLAKLPPPINSDPRIEIAKAQAYASMDDFKSQLQLAQAALQEARKRNARMMQAHAQLQLCWAHRNLGDVDAAFAACTEAHNLFSVFGDNVSAAVSSNDTATWLFDRGRYAEAKQLYDQVIAANRQAGAQADLAGAYVNRARTLARMGKPYDAEDDLKQALQVAGQVDDKYDEAIALINMGVVISRLGRGAEAEQDVQHALDLARDIKDKATEATALSNLAEYQSETDSGRALISYQEALRLRKELGEQAGIATCLGNMADVLFRRGDLAGAQKNDGAALQIDTQLKDKDGMAHDWLSLAELDLERGQLPQAEDKALQAAKVFREDQDADLESEAASILVRVLVAEHRAADAELYVKRMQEIASKDEETDFYNRLSTAEYLNAVGKGDEAIQKLAMLPDDAKKAGMNFNSLRARLELVRLRSAFRPASELRQELFSIKDEANRAGFRLLLDQARGIRP
jgi:serine/threonine protein kinase/tetratricopeptide (TPR) repeat protein